VLYALLGKWQIGNLVLGPMLGHAAISGHKFTLWLQGNRALPAPLARDGESYFDYNQHVLDGIAMVETLCRSFGVWVPPALDVRGFTMEVVGGRTTTQANMEVLHRLMPPEDLAFLRTVNELKLTCRPLIFRRQGNDHDKLALVTHATCRLRRSNQQDSGSEAWTSTFWTTTASRPSPTTSNCRGAAPSTSWTCQRGQKSGRQGELGSSRGSAVTSLSKVACVSPVRCQLFAALAVHIRIRAPTILIIVICQAQHVLDVPRKHWPAGP